MESHYVYLVKRNDGKTIVSYGVTLLQMRLVFAASLDCSYGLIEATEFQIANIKYTEADDIKELIQEAIRITMERDEIKKLYSTCEIYCVKEPNKD